jgi:hypothetical protein
MKKIIFLLIIIGAVFHLHKNRASDGAPPEPIKNPVFAQQRIEVNIQNRTIEQVLFAATKNAQDCAEVNRTGLAGQTSGAVMESNLRWDIKSADCKDTIEPRYAAMFENKPTHLAYLSFDRGSEKEREMRVIFWGLSAEESKASCERMLTHFRPKRKGAIHCIPAVQ